MTILCVFGCTHDLILLDSVKVWKAILPSNYTNLGSEFGQVTLIIDENNIFRQTLLAGENLLNKLMQLAIKSNVFVTWNSTVHALLRKPINIILHVGKNDAKNLPSRTVLDNLLKLKALAKDSLPMCRVFISTPTLRIDDDEAQITVGQLTKHFLQLKIDTANSNSVMLDTLEAKVYTCINYVQNFSVEIFQIQLKNFEKPKDIQVSRITDLLFLNILSDVSLPLQTGKATHF